MESVYKAPRHNRVINLASHSFKVKVFWERKKRWDAYVESQSLGEERRLLCVDPCVIENVRKKARSDIH